MKFRTMTIVTALLSVLTLFGQSKENNKKSNHMGTIHLTTQEFKDRVYDYEANPKSFNYRGSMPAIVDFFATWCGPCKALSPVLDELAKEYEGKILIYKVDVDQNRELSGVFGIRSVPTLLFISADGQPTMAPGAPSKAQLKNIIDKLIK